MKEYYPEGWLGNTAVNRRNMLTPSALAQAQANETVLEATVLMCDTEHNLTVDQRADNPEPHQAHSRHSCHEKS